jgi:hypothetical protein
MKRTSLLVAVASLTFGVLVGVGCSHGDDDAQYATKAPPIAKGAVADPGAPDKKRPGAMGAVNMGGGASPPGGGTPPTGAPAAKPK